MHIPDGYLAPATYGSLWAVMVPVWTMSSRRIKSAFAAARIPYLAMAAAFSLIIMIVAVPLPGGTTGHLCGAALVAILLGPSAGIMAVSVSLIIQAVVFGDGGLTAIAANCFNIAFIGSLVGYYVFKWSPCRNEDKAHQNSKRRAFFSAAFAAYISINSSALLTAIELGVQPLMNTGYFPYSMKVTIPALMLAHLCVIGPLEALMTGYIFQAIRKWPGFKFAASLR